MEGQALTSTHNQHQHLLHPHHPYPSSRLVQRHTVTTFLSLPVPLAVSPSSSSTLQATQHHHNQHHLLQTPLDLLPAILPQQSSLYQVQLSHYNNLISSRSKVRLHAQPLPPLLSTTTSSLSSGLVQAAPVSARSGSAAATADRDRKPKDTAVQRGHGHTSAAVVLPASHPEHPLITPRDTPIMASKKSDAAAAAAAAAKASQSTSHPRLPGLPAAHAQALSSITTAQHSSSVPSTPRQRARQFSFGSREPSPTLPQSHSPRSAYSESNSTLPSLRPPPPPRLPGCKYETAMAFSKRRMPYSLGSDWLEKVKPSTLKDKLSEADEKKLSMEMRELYGRLIPSPESEAKRERFRKKLEKLLNDEWPGHDIKVHMFGSSGNLLCTDDSDVDICITTEWKELENVCMLAAVLAKHGMEKVICVSTAKVPIVKIWDPELSLACDMNVNNTLAMENTRMIKTYVQIDERVRPLAMIIKYWTKRRIVNDAAFGGTLSSYTWICMIIHFLQSRNPPVLPALHQEPHVPKAGTNDTTSFADDLTKLRGFGDSNKETLGELLFQFFRYYGYELDYDKYVLSVRLGKLITKTEKGWHIGTNNSRLCVEEPFNIGRNLGNTADETSFRGLHMEIRRAFDLLGAANFSECCEEYVFPKEEEKTFVRPSQQPQAKVTMTRSSSQSNRGRSSNYRGRNNHRSGNSNRRASSGTYDNPPYMPQALTPAIGHEAWQNAQTQLHNDLYATYSVLQAQETNLRLQLYTQSQAYAHAQAQAFAQAQRLQANNSNGNRDRNGSFEAPPLTAPIRPDMYFYPLPYQAVQGYGHQSPTGYPSSPSMSPALPELRRSAHRSTVTGAGMNIVSSSSMRSHSQPAARSVPASMTLQGPTSTPGSRSVQSFQTARPINGSSMPNFLTSANSDQALETGTERSGDSPQEENKEHLSYYGSGSSPNGVQQGQSLAAPTSMAIPSFGDLPEGQARRRQSAENFPSGLINDRLRRSRSPSPSPLGHNRRISSTTPPTNKLQQSASSGNLGAMNGAPMVVNGSTFTPEVEPMARPTTIDTSSSYDDCGYPVAPYGESMYRPEGLGLEIPQQLHLSVPTTPKENKHPRSAPVVNGSVVPPEPIPAPVVTSELPVLKNRSPTKAEKTFLQHNGGVSPLDLSCGPEKFHDPLPPHLSPVYETRSPSPTANRKFEPGTETKSGSSKDSKEKADSTSNLKLAAAHNLLKQAGSSRANGHTKNAKSEGSGPSNWQQISKPKKKTQGDKSGNASKAEQPPRNVADRKGG